MWLTLVWHQRQVYHLFLNDRQLVRQLFNNNKGQVFFWHENVTGIWKMFFTTVHYWLVKLKTETHTCAYKPLKALYLPFYLNEIIWARLVYKTSNFKHYQFKINWFKNIQLHKSHLLYHLVWPLLMHDIPCMFKYKMTCLHSVSGIIMSGLK